jgi:hypothetical protein
VTAPLPDPRANLIWAAVDLDGCLAEPLWTPGNPTREIGQPILRNVEKARELAEHGFKIIIHTARPWTDYEAIEQWLNHWNIPWRRIQCGKVLAAIYVDDRGRNSEEDSWLPWDDPVAQARELRARFRFFHVDAE